jgi:hypothetical protein
MYPLHKRVGSHQTRSRSSGVETENFCPYGVSIMKYWVADKSLARPISRCILFDGENISFDASLVVDIISTNIPSIMIINRIYEHQNLVVVVCFLAGRAKDLSALPYSLQSLVQTAELKCQHTFISLIYTSVAKANLFFSPPDNTLSCPAAPITQPAHVVNPTFTSSSDTFL